MTRSTVVLLTLGAILAGCGNEVAPVLAGSPDRPVVLDSVSGDSVLSYHPTLPDSLVPPQVPAPNPTPADSVSPTGRAPRLIWTPQRQGVWNRMRNERHPLFVLLEDNCRVSKQGSPRYGDDGQWCTLHYQMTGDVSSARNAWSRFANLTASVPGPNEVREFFVEAVIMYDWLYPALTPTERLQAVTNLERWAQFTLGIGTAQYVGGTRTSDSDALVGYYFGLIALDLVGENTVPATRRWRTERGAAAWIPLTPVGGLDATGLNRSTLRNAIAEFASVRGAGGEWNESAEYNLGTLKLLMLGVEAVRTATGVDHFPEVTQFLIEAARMQTYHVTSDVQQALQWGDEENPRAFVGRMFKRITMLGMLAGVTQGTAQGAEVQGLVGSIFSQYGYRGWLSAEPWARIYFFYDPYAATSDWRRPGAAFASGRGLLQVREGSSLFSGMLALPTAEDHEVKAFANFQLYRNGEWVLTNPLGYSGSAVEGESHNSMLIAGMSSMPQRSLIDQRSGSGWWSVTGRTGGPLTAAGYWDPPPAFLRAWTRSIVYLTRGGVDWVVTIDDVDATHPEALPKFDRYSTAIQGRMRGKPLVEWIVHMPEAPTADGPSRIRWRTSNGQPVIVHRVETSLPWRLIDETQLWAGSQSFRTSEMKYQVRIEGPNGPGRLMHAISVGDENPPAVVALPDGIQFGATEVRVVGGVVSVTN